MLSPSSSRYLYSTDSNGDSVKRISSVRNRSSCRASVLVTSRDSPSTPSAFPVPSGSNPNSAGSTTANSTPAATAAAPAEVATMRAGDGPSGAGRRHAGARNRPPSW